MVGTTGFEPATSRTPSERATRLRYVPKIQLISISDGLGMSKRVGIIRCDQATLTFLEARAVELPMTVWRPFGRRLKQLELLFAQ